MPPNSEYIHGSREEEQERLSWMNDLLNERELAEIAVRGDERVLEMGAGTGIFARAIAARLPRGGVIGIERDERQLAVARAKARGVSNLEFRAGDVLTPPLAAHESGGFDLVHARFVLEHLSRPDLAMAAMARAVRPGGRVIVVDDDHDTLRLWPEAPEFMVLWLAYCELYSRRGMDPWIGRRLAHLAVEAGLRPARATVLFFGACKGMPAFEAARDNFRGVIEGSREELLTAGLVSIASYESGQRDFDAWATASAASLWYAVPYVEATRDA